MEGLVEPERLPAGSPSWPRVYSRSGSTWRRCWSWSRSSPTKTTPSPRRRPTWRTERWSSSRTSSPGTTGRGSSVTAPPPALSRLCLRSQLFGGREAAVHAHPPTETSGAENRSPVHSEAPVRTELNPDLTSEHNREEKAPEFLLIFALQVSGEAARVQLPAESQSSVR